MAADKAVAQFEVAEGVLKAMVKKAYDGTHGGQFQSSTLVQTTLISEMVRAHGAYTKLKELGEEERILTPERQKLLRTVIGMRHVPNAFDLGVDGSVRGWCDVCSCKLAPGPKWYHKPGSHSDLCRKCVDKLPSEGAEEEYIIVEKADSLGAGKQSYHIDQGKLLKAREMLEIFGVDLKMGEAREMARENGTPKAMQLHTIHTWGLGATYRAEDGDYLTDVIAYYYQVPSADGSFLSYWKIQRFDSKGDPVEGPLADLPVEAVANPIFADSYVKIVAAVRAAEIWISEGDRGAQAQEYELRETVQLENGKMWFTNVRCRYPDKALAFHVDETGQATEFNPGSPRSTRTVNYELTEAVKDPPTRACLRELEPLA